MKKTDTLLTWERARSLLAVRDDDPFGLVMGRVQALHAVLRTLNYEPAGPIDAAQSDSEIMLRVQALKEKATRNGDAITAYECEIVLERYDQDAEPLHLFKRDRMTTECGLSIGGYSVAEHRDDATCPDCLRARDKTDIHLVIRYGPTAGSTWCYDASGPETVDPAEATCTDCLDRYREHAS